MATANEVIERLIVDDGEKARGHRKNLFSKEMNYCGISTGPHESQGNVVLFEYTKEILREG